MARSPSTPEAPADALIVCAAALPSMVLTLLLTTAALCALQRCPRDTAAPSGRATPTMETVR